MNRSTNPRGKRRYTGRLKQRQVPYKMNAKVNWLVKQAKISRGTELAGRNYIQYGRSGTVDATGTLQHISAISTGTGIGSRKDLKIQISTLEYRYSLDAADTVNTARILVLQSKANQAVTISDTFRASSGGSGLGVYEPANTELFFVLADHIIQAGDQPDYCEGKITIFPRKQVTYNSTASNTQQDGAIYIAFFSDSNVANHPTITGWAKLKYFD